MSKLEELIQRYCPDGVEFVPLGEVCKFERGKGFSKSDISGEGRPIILYGELYTTYREYIEEIFSHTTSSIETAVFAGKGDLLLPISSTTKEAQIGKASVLCVDEVIVGGDAIILHHNQNPGYLMYLINSCWFEAYKMKCVSGTTIMHLSPSKFSLLSIPIPPLPVQEEIVRVLDTFTELQAELQAELQKRLQQYNYYRDNLLSFEGREDVQWMRLGDIGDNLDRKRKPITAGKREPGKIPYYGASGIVDYVKDYIFDGDYLLVSEDGANLLTRTYPIAFSISGKNWVNNHAHVIEFKERATRKFVEYYLNSIDLSPWISAGAQPKLTQDNLNRLTIPVPSLSEQQKIVDILDRFYTLTTDLSQGLPAEIEKRRQQYEFYRDKLLTFKRKEA